jgi:glutaredoxin
MVKQITIFTTNTCTYCGMVKRYLDTKGLNYEVVKAEALEMSGALTVPITVVTKTDDSQQVVVGYNLQQLAPAVA